LSDDKVISLENYKKEKNKIVPSLKAFLLDGYYILPEMGIMIHILSITDKSVHYTSEMIYVMEDQYGNFFADTVEEETCEGWEELDEEVFTTAVEKNIPTSPWDR
jgi:hypothetical protein